MLDIVCDEVVSEDEAAADVVYHAAHLSADCDSVLSEDVCGLFALVGEDCELFAEELSHGGGVPGEDWVHEVNASLSHHDVEGLSCCVLDALCGVESDSPSLEVYTEAGGE